MEQSFKGFIDQAQSVLILLPTKPYFDQVAAGLSLFLTLREEKSVQIYSPSPMVVEFNRLIGVNKVTQELGNKNLVVSFVDYQASDIERVSYDIENGQFKLTVIPKDRISPPSQKQIELGYSGVSADMVILIGGANDSHFPALSKNELAGAKLIHIGTRDINLTGKKVISFSRPSSSVSELTGVILKDSGYSLNEDVATNLLTGIEDGSNSFTGNDVTADTFAIVSELMRSGGKRDLSQRVPENYPPGAIPASSSQGQIPRNYPPAMPQGQNVQQKASDQAQVQDEEEDENAPKDWFEPKIFKGTSVK